MLVLHRINFKVRVRKTSKKERLSEWVSGLKEENPDIGLVPTMGALHEGHLSLVKKAFSECDLVVVSIFVNPTQFDNKTDLEKYPRDLGRDLDLLKDFEDLIVFTPTAEELYGGKIHAEHFDFGPIADRMEGKYRTGHFDGVGTVLKLLFEVVRPGKAFFGEKDFQQLQIVKKLVRITGQPVEVVGCPTAREANGLAMSSRNERLTTKQREEAAFIHKTLQGAKRLFASKNTTFVADWARGEFGKNPHFELEYFEIAGNRAFVAAYIGNIRLIDNLSLENKEELC